MQTFMRKLLHWPECVMSILHKFVPLVFRERGPVCRHIHVLLLRMSEFGKCSAAFVHRCYGIISVFTSSFQLFMLLIMHVGSFSSFIWIFTASYEDSGAGKYSALREPLLETLFVVFTPNILIFTLSWFWKSLRIAKLVQYPFFFWPFHLRSCIY